MTDKEFITAMLNAVGHIVIHDSVLACIMEGDDLATALTRAVEAHDCRLPEQVLELFTATWSELRADWRDLKPGAFAIRAFAVRARELFVTALQELCQEYAAGDEYQQMLAEQAAEEAALDPDEVFNVQGDKA